MQPQDEDRITDSVQERSPSRFRRAYLAAAVAAVVACAVLSLGFVAGGDSRAQLPAGPVPLQRFAKALPVWYDAAGLHHGRRVEPTAVRLFVAPEGMDEPWQGGGVLALVRRGALYRDPVTADVWFHPWGGRPRVVGRSETGPGGDPSGDAAAWFDGGHLVVFDTARGRQISRTDEPPVVPYSGREHVSAGNGFKHVSADEVVWVSQGSGAAVVRRLDVASGKSTVLWTHPGGERFLEDVHGATRIWTGTADGAVSSALVGVVAGRPERRFPSLEPMGRLSATGRFVLSDAREVHGAAIADVRSGATWSLLPGEGFYAWIAWAYDDLALVLVEPDRGGPDVLLGCRVATRTCDELPSQGKVLLPTS